MEMESFENPWMRKIRFLTKTLLVSVAINIGLLTTLLYNFQVDSKKNKVKSLSKKVVLEESNGQVLDRYFKSSFEDLACELKDKSSLQDGYKKRDLALACLVNYHYLNLEKAISGKTLQRRNLTFIHHGEGENFQVEVFPNLDDLDFELVEKFIKEERYPFTTEGLFIDLKRKQDVDPSLEAAFLASVEFYTIYAALKRVDDALSKEKVLALLLGGDFLLFKNLFDKAKEGGDFLLAMRDLFSGYIQAKAPNASELWIAIDNEYIQRQLTDLDLHTLIQSIKENTLAVNIFLKQILCSVRSDEIRKEAALKLYEFSSTSVPVPYDHEKALKTFLPTMFVQKEVVKTEPVSFSPTLKKHTVSDGESLWKISRKYKVSIESLREVNHLKKDTLKPGQELLIP